MPEGKDYSRINNGRKELIDHILVSAALVKPLAAVSAEAIIDQPLPSVTQDPKARTNAPSSDHAPVVATFQKHLGRNSQVDTEGRKAKRDPFFCCSRNATFS
jgi:hypothetical protein